MRTFVNLLLTFSLLAACSTELPQDGVRYTDFPHTYELQGEAVPLDTALFRYPFRIRIQGDKAVVLDLHATDHFCQLFSYPDGRYQASFGKRGDSPREMLSAENLRWKGDFLWILDGNRSQLNKFAVSPSGDSLRCLNTTDLDNDVLRALDFVIYDDSTFIVPDYSGDSRFCWTDAQGRLLCKSGHIPSTDKYALKNTRPALAQAWRSFLDYNPSNGVLAAVTQLGEVFEIYNLRDSTHVVCIGPHGEPEFQVSQGYGIPTGIMGFCDIQVTDSAVYAVFHGQSFKEIRKSVQHGTHLPDGGRYLYVFSLTGKPLRKYVLDHYVYGVHVDEQNGVIVATDVNKDEPIIQYVLKK